MEQESNMQLEKSALVEIPKIPQKSTKPNEDMSIRQNPEKIFRDELIEQNKKTIKEATNMLQEHHTDAHR